MLFRMSWRVVLALATILSSSALRAADVSDATGAITSAAPSDAASQLAKKLLTSYYEAFNSGDAKALASLWKEDGEFISTNGTRIVGRDKIQAIFADFFKANPKSTITLTVMTARMDGENTLVIDALPKIAPQPVAGAKGERPVTIVWVRSDADWRIEGVMEKPMLPLSYEHLKQLEWMVGKWSCETSSPIPASVKISCDWTGNKSFLIITYSIVHNGTARHGTEVIGWLASKKTYHSQIFDSTGGTANGVWKQTDKKTWTVSFVGESADGLATKAEELFIKDGDDAMTIDWNNLYRDGAEQPDVPPMQLKREKPADAKK